MSQWFAGFGPSFEPATQPDPLLRHRFGVAWLLGSAVPLAGIAATPLVRTGTIPPTVAMVDLASAGLVVGWALSRAMAGLRAMVDGFRDRRRLEDLFVRHVGEDVAREALARGVTRGGETREATIMFVDPIGSTVATAVSHPTDVVNRANIFFAEVIDAVTGCGGWLNKFQGDGAMCVFGVPPRDDEHVVDAARAAEVLHERLLRLELEAGIGLATGVVVAGNVGTVARLEYTAMGAPVNLAARLFDAAKTQATPVLLSAPTPPSGGSQLASTSYGVPERVRAWRPPVAAAHHEPAPDSH